MKKLVELGTRRNLPSVCLLGKYCCTSMFYVHSQQPWYSRIIHRFAFARPDAVQQRQRHEDAQAQASEQLLQATEGGQGSQNSSGQHVNPLDRLQSSRLDVEMAAAASSMEISEEPEKRGLFGRRKAKAPRADTRSSQASSSRPFDVDLIDTSAYSDWAKDGYKPVLTLSLASQMSRSSRVTALALSEAGFLAAAWEDRLAIVDLRGPEVLFSEAERVDRDEIIVNLVWTICAQGDGQSVRVFPCQPLNIFCRSRTLRTIDRCLFLRTDSHIDPFLCLGHLDSRCNSTIVPGQVFR